MIYLVHFEKPYHHARHYLGYTTNLDQRITDHLAGQGARLMEVITAAGIEWRVVRTWEGGRCLERRLKNRNNTRLFCPICSGERGGKRANYKEENR